MENNQKLKLPISKQMRRQDRGRGRGSWIAEWQEIPISFNINTRTDWSGKVWLLQIQSPNPIYLVQENSPVHTTFIIYPSQHPNIKQTNISSCHPEERLEVTEYRVIIFWLAGLGPVPMLPRLTSEMAVILAGTLRLMWGNIQMRTLPLPHI